MLPAIERLSTDIKNIIEGHILDEHNRQSDTVRVSDLRIELNRVNAELSRTKALLMDTKQEKEQLALKAIELNDYIERVISTITVKANEITKELQELKKKG